MKTVNLVHAKAHLSELVAQAAAVRSCASRAAANPVGRLSAVEQPRKPVDVAALRALTDRMPMQQVSAGDFVWRMRDEGRY
jgi:antitoxin (DNA-binding transcriptional repressor) of toxin-antitoxin stability system